MNKLKVLNGVSLVFAMLLIGVSLLFGYLALVPIDVLKDWKLTVAQNSTFHPGETVKVHNQVDKTKALKPFAHRNIECIGSNGTFVSYHIADIPENIQNNIRTGPIVSDIQFKIPDDIPNLPTTCRFSITTDYRIVFFRTVTEYNTSNEFRVE